VAPSDVCWLAHAGRRSGAGTARGLTAVLGQPRPTACRNGTRGCWPQTVVEDRIGPLVVGTGVWWCGDRRGWRCLLSVMLLVVELGWVVPRGVGADACEGDDREVEFDGYEVWLGSGIMTRCGLWTGYGLRCGCGCYCSRGFIVTAYQLSAYVKGNFITRQEIFMISVPPMLLLTPISLSSGANKKTGRLLSFLA
jgi:hypothetical protein